jgi:8-oxo-dGTP diphosphatase
MQVDPKLTRVIDCLYRVAAKAVIIENGKVLLVQDKTDDGWCFPGGGIDIGENAAAALKRELAEEIGVEIQDIDSDNKVIEILIGHIKNGIPRCNIHFVASVDSSKVKATQETVALEWMPISELQNQKFDSSAGSKSDVINIVKQVAA